MKKIKPVTPLPLADYIASKVSVLEWDAMEEIVRARDGVWFVCPCGGEDHYAFRNWIPEGNSAWLSPVLNCYETEQQWLVKAIPVEDIILKEEMAYGKLLDRAMTLVPKIVKKRGMNADTLFFLRDTHGIPEELATEIMNGN